MQFFFQKEINYLSHIIDMDVLHKDPKKVWAIFDAPIPKDVTQVKAFTGMVNYYGKFVSNLTDILAPLYAISQSSTKFSWSSVCNKTFQKAKNIISSKKCLFILTLHKILF